MKKFSELAIQSRLSGDKIEIKDILGIETIITAFRIGPSKQDIGKRCLTLQIEYQDVKRIIFTGSEVLMKELELLATEDFPFMATIVKESGSNKTWFKFI